MQAISAEDEVRRPTMASDPSNRDREIHPLIRIDPSGKFADWRGKSP
jgi:hypothetical protein